MNILSHNNPYMRKHSSSSSKYSSHDHSLSQQRLFSYLGSGSDGGAVDGDDNKKNYNYDNNLNPQDPNQGRIQEIVKIHQELVDAGIDVVQLVKTSSRSSWRQQLGRLEHQEQQHPQRPFDLEQLQQPVHPCHVSCSTHSSNEQEYVDSLVALYEQLEDGGVNIDMLLERMLELVRPVYYGNPLDHAKNLVDGNTNSDDVNSPISSLRKNSGDLTLLTDSINRNDADYGGRGYKNAIATGDRIAALHEQLRKLGIHPDKLAHAAVQSLQDPTKGASKEFGISAIRAYRSFVFPKESNVMDNDVDDDETSNSKKRPTKKKQRTLSTLAAASLCARQVEFLIKRHKSHQADWVRHTDTVLVNTTGEVHQPSRSTPHFPLMLLLDNVRSAFNVGSLFRTADACGCQLVVTTGITPYPFGNGADKLQKSALGAQLVVPSQHFATTPEAIRWLRETYPDHLLLGMETTERSILYTNMSYTDYQQRGIVIVLGNEVTGVDTDVIPLLDLVVEVPMFGSKNSLNIAACAPVVLYEILRQWQHTPSMRIANSVDEKG